MHAHTWGYGLTHVCSHACKHAYIRACTLYTHTCEEGAFQSNNRESSQVWGLLIEHLPFKAAQASPEARPQAECSSAMSWCLELTLVYEKCSKPVGKVNKMIRVYHPVLHVYHPVHTNSAYQVLFWAQKQ